MWFRMFGKFGFTTLNSKLPVPHNFSFCIYLEHCNYGSAGMAALQSAYKMNIE